MAIVSGFFLGVGFLTSPQASQIAAQYNQLTLYGASTVDKTRVLKTYLTDTELDALTITDTYSWTANTLLYADYEQNLLAGNLSSNEPITGWRVTRTRTGDATSKLLAEQLDADVSGYNDYRGVKNEEYVYSILPLTANSVLTPLVTSSLTVDYCDVILIDETSGESFLFDLNLDINAIETVQGETIYERSYSQYPAVSQDDKKFRRGSINCLMGFVEDRVFNDTTQYLNQLETFILNKNIKVLKDKKGNVIRVRTGGFTHDVDQNKVEFPTTVSFDFVEVGAV